MNNIEIIALAEKFIYDSPGNYITKEAALDPHCEGLKIYEAPIFAFGEAEDEIYESYKSVDVIGSLFLSPTEWMPETKTVISFFLPYTDIIKTANARDNNWPANEWLHGRYEGQQLLSQLTEYLAKVISEAGYKTLIPSTDARFEMKMGDSVENNSFAVSWSERHAAFACGLGTFGLSRGIITKKGMAGRLGSLLTDLDLPKDSRTYKDIYEYCNMCGLCIDKCPAQAISYKEVMKHRLCSDFCNKVRAKEAPRYGCGKCQVGVPCESGIPKV